jgi:hypothetical protein
VEGTTFISEKDLTFKNKVDTFWHVPLVVNDRFEAADVDRIQVVSPWLSSLQQLELHVDHDVAAEFFLGPAEHSLEHLIKVLKQKVKQPLLQPGLKLVEEVLCFDR